MFEYVITNGILIDKHNNLHQVKKDIHVKNGKIVCIADTIDPHGMVVLDAAGSYISAGMIDVHVHNRLRNQPGRKNESSLPSIDMLGVDRGVTTVIECGSVALKDFNEFIADSNQAQTRYYGLLSGHGEDGFGTAGSQDVDLINPQHYYDAVAENPGYIVGLKVACSNTITNDKGYGLTKKAKEIAKGLNMPLTIHVGNFPPDPNGLIEFLDEGDVVTHSYHGKEISLFKNDGTPKEAFVRARKRGVLFDVGHGSASFSWIVYDKARRKGFYPDLISTDIRAVNIDGPVWSLATVMSKILNLGMDLEDVVACNTYTAAKTYKLHNLGEIKEGAVADFTFFTIENVDLELVDCYYQMQHINKLICPNKAIVSKNGKSEIYACISGRPDRLSEKA